jgi:hypothetical protein
LNTNAKPDQHPMDRYLDLLDPLDPLDPLDSEHQLDYPGLQG